MGKFKAWVPLSLLVINILLSFIYLERLNNEPLPRFGLLGLIPVIIGVISFIYINRYSNRKTTLIIFAQIFNIIFIIFPLITLVYFMTKI